MTRFDAAEEALRHVYSSDFTLTLRADREAFRLGGVRVLKLQLACNDRELGTVFVMIGPVATSWCLEFSRVVNADEATRLANFLPNLIAAMSALR